MRSQKWFKVRSKRTENNDTPPFSILFRTKQKKEHPTGVLFLLGLCLVLLLAQECDNARFLSGGGVLFDHSALGRLVDRLVDEGERFLRFGEILRGRELLDVFHALAHRIESTHVIDASARRSSDRSFR